MGINHSKENRYKYNTTYTYEYTIQEIAFTTYKSNNVKDNKRHANAGWHLLWLTKIFSIDQATITAYKFLARFLLGLSNIPTRVAMNKILRNHDLLKTFGQAKIYN